MADVITTNRDAILARWAECAKRSASARGLTDPELMNIMPVYLAALARPSGEDPPHRLAELVETHFSSRLRHGFDLSEIQNEFALLGRSILHVWMAMPPDERPDFAALDDVLSTLQDSAGSMTDMFARHLFEDAQVEKRYLRLIRQALSGSLPDGAGAGDMLIERLHAALAVVMEAMRAATAAILVYEPVTEQLVMTASVGLAKEGLARYARSLAPSSLVGLTASREEATEILDAETTELDVTDALRHSGIHAILGVRLPPQRRLVGVMYIGMREHRPFLPRERRRIEALAESFALLIENDQLYTALERQLDALRAEQRLRDVLVSIIAHDLRGPLSAARLAAQMLDRARDEAVGPASLQGRAALIVRNLDRVDRMVRDLLDAQRLHAGERLAITREPCDLSAIAREVVDELSRQHGDRFVLDVPPAPVQGEWGASELRRALWNLASNAVKYGSAEAPVRISVRLRDGGAEVAVHNEGPPIPPEEQATLFEPFARAGGELAAHGWGLGLAIVRGVAEAHDGSIEVDSTPDRGTTFTLRVRSA